MKIRLLQWLLIILSIAFLLVLTVLLFTEKDGDVIFKEGVTEFGQGRLKPSQTSQSKEKALTQSAFIQRTSSYLPSQASLNNTNTSMSEDESRKILLDYTNKLDATYLWGTYKPHLIHALTQRTTKPLTVGFMYVGAQKLIHSYKNIKASSASYFSEYLYHNGKTFSESVFTDKTGGVGLNNYFFKEEMSDSRQRWHSVTVKDKNSHATASSAKATFIYYFIIEDFKGEEDDRYLSYDADQGVILVRRPGLQDISESFKIVVYNEAKAIPFQDVQKYVFTDNQYKKSDTWRVQDIIEANLNSNPTEGFSTLLNNSNTQNESTNIIAVQFVIDPHTTFAIDISYDTSRDPLAVDNDYEAVDQITSYAETSFMPEYKAKFTRNVPLDNQKCAVSALSNLISGIGYYYGNVVVKGSNTVEPKLPLYTGTPSKTEFPRGFLWDEGFHGLVYCRWNMEICLDVLIHWMGTQLSNGWIPREQLRGSESVNNGNPNYVAQVKDEANPPTLMFLISAIIEGKEKAQLPEGAIELFNTLYPKLKKWYDWFFATQMSEKYEGLFAWKSDLANSGLVLGSGLDDYPRGLAGGGKKPLGHLDLQVWMIFMADNMEKIARFGGKKDDIGALRSMRVKLREQLKLFYDPVEKIHKDLVEDSNGNKKFSPHFGYVNLFPLFFGLIQRDSEELDTLLDYIQNPMKLWSKYGLLSLAKDDNMYMRTHDSYWGGPIWININYLTLRGLKLYYYSNSRARKVYEDLRQNIINTVKGQKEEHGYFFEQYNQDTGAGQKNYPFTGWTSTLMLIIYEQY